MVYVWSSCQGRSSGMSRDWKWWQTPFFGAKAGQASAPPLVILWPLVKLATAVARAPLEGSYKVFCCEVVWVPADAVRCALSKEPSFDWSDHLPHPNTAFTSPYFTPHATYSLL